MTWSYDPALPADKDKIRALVGDTDTTDQLVSDEAIAVWLAQTGNIMDTAALIADGISASFGRRANLALDSLRVDFQARSDKFRDIASNLRLQATRLAGGLGTPYVGGVSISDMDSVEDNTDREPSRFKVGMQDFPGIVPSTDSDAS